MDTPPFFDVVYTARAIRRINPDPLPPELVRRVLEADTIAPSGTNRQPWRFIVVTDPTTRRHLGEYHTRGFTSYDGGEERMAGPMLGGASADEHQPQEPKGITEQQMVDRYALAPVLIVVCHTGDGRGAVASVDRRLNDGGWTYPAIQHLRLAARAPGLGAHITTLVRVCRADVKELLGMPGARAPVGQSRRPRRPAVGRQRPAASGGWRGSARICAAPRGWACSGGCTRRIGAGAVHLSRVQRRWATHGSAQPAPGG